MIHYADPILPNFSFVASDGSGLNARFPPASLTKVCQTIGTIRKYPVLLYSRSLFWLGGFFNASASVPSAKALSALCINLRTATLQQFGAKMNPINSEPMSQDAFFNKCFKNDLWFRYGMVSLPWIPSIYSDFLLLRCGGDILLQKPYPLTSWVHYKDLICS